MVLNICNGIVWFAIDHRSTAVAVPETVSENGQGELSQQKVPETFPSITGNVPNKKLYINMLGPKGIWEHFGQKGRKGGIPNAVWDGVYMKILPLHPGHVR
jgi:hypothetical protein